MKSNFIFAMIAGALMIILAPRAANAQVTVLPTVETAPCQDATSSVDVCDDSAIWIHPTNPSLSTVIGDDKNGGILVWDLQGVQLQYIEPDTNMNNLDIRYNFPLSGSYSTGQSHTSVDLVGVVNEEGGALSFYKVNPSTRLLEKVSEVSLSIANPYGGCMYRSPVSGKYYFFVNWQNGVWQQIELSGGGTVTGTMVRTHDAGSQTEGCVADDVHAYYYIGEEAVGVWRYGAEPNTGTTRIAVDNVSGNLRADVEGMAIYYKSNGDGYLIVSSQGSSKFDVYQRKPASSSSANTYIGAFKVGANGVIDATGSTDGLDVTNYPLGPSFPNGMLVVHDASNTGGSKSNHKYVPFQNVASVLSLSMDTTWNPRTGSTNSATSTPLPSSAPSSPSSTPAATATTSPSSGSPTFVESVNGVSSGSSTVSSGNVSGGSKLYLTSVAITGNESVNSISGLGLNWSLVKNLCTARGGTGITVYSAYGNASSGVVTADLSGSATNAAINVTSYSNVNGNNSIGAVVAANSNGVNGSCSGGTDTASYSVPINARGNSIVYGTGSIRLREHSAGAGFTERDEVHTGSGGDVVGLFVQDRSIPSSGTVDMAGNLSSATNWAVVAVEVVGGSSSGGLPGDANGDRVVDGKDYVVWLNNYNTTTSEGSSKGDFNNDGRVDGKDYVAWVNNFGSSQTAPTATPTPTVTNSPTSTPTPTPPPTRTPTPTATPTVPPISSTTGIWLSTEEIMALPMSGAGWNHVVSEAESSWGSANLGDNNSTHDVKTLAGALVAVRRNDTAMRNKTIQGLQSAMNSSLTRTLELGRGLQSYVIAADIIGYRTPEFEDWVFEMLTGPVDGRIGNNQGLHYEALRDPSNWGGMERVSSIAAALYLKDTTRLSELARAHREFVGENTSPKLMVFTDTNWHPNPNDKVGVARVGATIQGINVSGILPEDWRRTGEFTWPPPTGSGANYRWEGMQGYVVSAVLLGRANLVPLNAGNNAIVRSMDILYEINDIPGSDDAWMPWLVNKYWGTNYPTTTSVGEGKGIAFTEWTHQ